MKARCTCRRRRCLPPSSRRALKDRKPTPRYISPIGNRPGLSPTSAKGFLHAFQVPRSEHFRQGGVTAPRAARFNRRVAPVRLSPAAPCGRGSPAPQRALPTGTAAGRVPSVTRTRARARPPSPLPRHRSVRAYRRRRRQPQPAVAPTALHKRCPRRRRGSCSTTLV